MYHFLSAIGLCSLNELRDVQRSLPSESRPRLEYLLGPLPLHHYMLYKVWLRAASLRELLSPVTVSHCCLAASPEVRECCYTRRKWTKRDKAIHKAKTRVVSRVLVLRLCGLVADVGNKCASGEILVWFCFIMSRLHLGEFIALRSNALTWKV